MEGFKAYHKECEQLRTSGFSTSEIKKVRGALGSNLKINDS